MGENLVEHRRSAMATENCVNGGHDYPDIRQQLANAMADDKTMSIAVVGMSCRLSGGSRSLESLWDLLSTGRSG